jgi:hypothetical protein
MFVSTLKLFMFLIIGAFGVHFQKALGLPDTVTVVDYATMLLCSEIMQKVYEKGK